ncbi:hypothetical protein QA584_27670 [Anaerocolumna sp. AGMB13025]|uniref:hypothetical protein n=1 Tax=Anaerocolumna sp. AGMB13025 TaxID=3039116 RepID=UPI00241F8181|nr:hypothetical protein [Anaerocolumna sp. AGMB13025]WFR57341.1 hypothetical protein QA584_27670 [Anaerocolumna sp. AGMB13025]
MWFLILITAAAISALIILWFYTVWKLFSRLRGGLISARQQIYLHQKSADEAGSWADFNCASSQLSLSIKLFNETVRQYNKVLHKPYYFFTAMILGFRTEKQQLTEKKG